MLNGELAAPTQILLYPATPTYSGPIVLPDIVRRTRQLEKKIKAADAYTMGRDMDLEDELPVGDFGPRYSVMLSP